MSDRLPSAKHLLSGSVQEEQLKNLIASGSVSRLQTFKSPGHRGYLLAATVDRTTLTLSKANGEPREFSSLNVLAALVTSLGGSFLEICLEPQSHIAVLEKMATVAGHWEDVDSAAIARLVTRTTPGKLATMSPSPFDVPMAYRVLSAPALHPQGVDSDLKDRTYAIEIRYLGGDEQTVPIASHLIGCDDVELHVGVKSRRLNRVVNRRRTPEGGADDLTGPTQAIERLLALEGRPNHKTNYEMVARVLQEWAADIQRQVHSLNASACASHAPAPQPPVLHPEVV